MCFYMCASAHMWVRVGFPCSRERSEDLRARRIAASHLPPIVHRSDRCLIGTGLLTVALGLLAYDLAGSDAGAVLGTALAIKMLAYVGVAPIISALTHRVPRKVLLVSADVIRALIALALPFVDQTWQIYVLIFLLQSASADVHSGLSIGDPSVLVEEEDYTRALSLSRLAYDLESLLSPILQQHC